MRAARRPALAMALGAALLALTACGGSDTGDAATDTAGAPASAPATTSPAPSTAEGATAPGTAAPGTATPDAGAPGTPAVTAAPAPVPEILQFSAPLVGGQDTFDGASVAGRPVAFWFWAPT